MIAIGKRIGIVIVKGTVLVIVLVIVRVPERSRLSKTSSRVSNLRTLEPRERELPVSAVRLRRHLLEAPLPEVPAARLLEASTSIVIMIVIVLVTVLVMI